jgi:hypothetical protein
MKRTEVPPEGEPRGGAITAELYSLIGSTNESAADRHAFRQCCSTYKDKGVGATCGRGDERDGSSTAEKIVRRELTAIVVGIGAEQRIDGAIRRKSSPRAITSNGAHGIEDHQAG